MAAPIALFVYNRPFHTEQTVESLRKNFLANESDLIIFSDGPKLDKDVGQVKVVRAYIRRISGFRSLEIIESPINKGLANSIIDGVSKTLQNRETLVVLEDDMITSPYFLSYVNQGLNLYQSDESVISIHGYVYPVAGNLPRSFFLKGAQCWGWATWRRGWALFERDGSKLLNELLKNKATREFDYDNSYPFTKMLADQIKGLNNSWAIRWQASAFLNDKLTLYPGKSLVRNIGFDDSGTHSGAADKERYDTSVDPDEIQLEKIEIRESAMARKSFAKFFRTSRTPLVKRAIRKAYRIYQSLRTAK